MVEMMDNKKKTPALRGESPGKRYKVKILFYDFIRLPYKKQVRSLSWGEKYAVDN